MKLKNFVLDESSLGKNSVISDKICTTCEKGFMVLVEYDMHMIFCSNALCNVNYVQEIRPLHFLDFRKREVNKK